MITVFAVNAVQGNGEMKMTKFELPEKPKKTNTSDDFNNLRKAVDELDKFDYAWKTYANKADRRINAANKYIEELERENQRLVAENLAVKTLVDNAKQQQALPVVPECVAKDVKRLSLSTLADWHVAVSYISKETLEWLSTTGNINVFLGKSWTLCSLKINGFKVEKPQLFYLKNKLTTSYLALDTNTGYYEHWGEEIIPKSPIKQGYKIAFTQQEIDSMQTGSYEQIEVVE